MSSSIGLVKLVYLKRSHMGGFRKIGSTFLGSSLQGNPPVWGEIFAGPLFSNAPTFAVSSELSDAWESLSVSFCVGQERAKEGTTSQGHRQLRGFLICD